MSIKWDEKDVLDHAKNLKSPFEGNKQNGNGLARLVEQLTAKAQQPLTEGQPTRVPLPPVRR